MDQFLTLLDPAHFVDLEQVLLALLLSFTLCSVFAGVYYWTFQGLNYSRAFIHTMILGGMVVSMLLMAIGNNVARGLGILGTLVIIRFRTPIRDPRDMIFLFACFGVGIATGSGAVRIAVLGTAAITLTAVFLHVAPFASRRQYEGLLRFSVPAGVAVDDQIRQVLQECCSAFYLLAMREAVQGDMIEYAYQVRLLDPSYQAELVERLHAIEDVVDPSLLMQRTTVEL